MKKLRSFLTIGLVVVIIMSIMCQTFVIANAANTSQSSVSVKSKYNVSVLDLVRLKNYLAGVNTDAVIEDYNTDGIIDASDLVTLIKILLGIPVDEDVDFDLDIDGFFNQVVKP